MASDKASFASLVARARAGEHAALEELARSYEPEVRVVARLRLGPALRPYLDSVDMVQSVQHTLMLGLRQNKFDISTPGKLLALALTIVRRKATRYWRHLRRQQRLSSVSSGPSGLPELLVSLSDSHDDPARAAEFNDQVAQLCDALNPVERQVVQLRLEGYSTAEAARTLGIDADVLRVQLSRLRRRLRKQQIAYDWL